MTFSPQLFWRAHRTIRFISGKCFLENLWQISQINSKQSQILCNLLCGSNLRCPSYNFGCTQASRGAEAWEFPRWLPKPSRLPSPLRNLCCGSRQIFFQGVVLSQFSKAVNSGDFCLAHLLTKRLATVWWNMNKLKTFQDAILKVWQLPNLIKLNYTQWITQFTQKNYNFIIYTLCFKTNTLTPILQL